jgi:hypothetical protein
VPTGTDDPKVAWASTTERSNFFAFVSTTSLQNYLGRNAPRNRETSPWNQTLDLKITQEIPLYKRARAEIFADFLNLPVLLGQKFNIRALHKNWGYLEEIPFSYRRGVAAATYNAAGNGGQGVWNYTFNSGTLDSVPITTNDTQASRWQVQVGMRIIF